MQLATIWKQLQRVQDATQEGAPETQDTAIAALQDMLYELNEALFPSFVYPLLTDVFRHYCRSVLPDMGMSIADQQFVSKEFGQTIGRLIRQEQAARQLEGQLKQVFARVKSGTFESANDVMTAICEFIAPERDRDEVSKAIENSYRVLLNSPFTANHVIPFFEALLDESLQKEGRAAVNAAHDLFRHQLQEFVQMQAVLVDTKTHEALITRLDVLTVLQSGGFDRLDFESKVDFRMFESCWNAVQAARAFLAEEFPNTLRHTSLHISCCFPNPAAEYNDSSASLLLCLKIIGDALDLEIDPDTVATGEVDASGKILPVAYTAEKIEAAIHHPTIQRVMLPYDVARVSYEQTDMIVVNTISDAVEQYYGKPFRKKLEQSRHEKESRRDRGVIILPCIVNPVTECDYFVFKRAQKDYRKKGAYQDAIEAFEFIASHFQQEESSADAQQLKAQSLGYLGVIYTQQQQIEKSLTALHEALRLWKRLGNRAEYVNTLLRIGSLYRYALHANATPSQWKMSLYYYRQSRQLLYPSMKQFAKLESKYYRNLSYLYYWSAEYDLAEQYCYRSMECGNGKDAVYQEWNYHTVSQHLGRILAVRGQHDRAYDRLKEAADAPALQTPHNRARSLWALSEFFLSTGESAKGQEHAEQAEQLCLKFGLTAEQQMLRNLLQKYRMSPLS